MTVKRICALALAVGGVALAACGGSGSSSDDKKQDDNPGPGGKTYSQQAFVAAPEHCSTDPAGATQSRVLVYVTEHTDWCTQVKEFGQNHGCPPVGETMLQIYVGKGLHGGSVSPVDPGTYTSGGSYSGGLSTIAEATLYAGTAAGACTTTIADSVSVELTQVAGSIAGTYTAKFGTVEKKGSIDAEICFQGVEDDCTAAP